MFTIDYLSWHVYNRLFVMSSSPITLDRHLCENYPKKSIQTTIPKNYHVQLEAM
jgi:hypothetical protein